MWPLVDTHEIVKSKSENNNPIEIVIDRYLGILKQNQDHCGAFGHFTDDDGKRHDVFLKMFWDGLQCDSLGFEAEMYQYLNQYIHDRIPNMIPWVTTQHLDNAEAEQFLNDARDMQAQSTFNCLRSQNPKYMEDIEDDTYDGGLTILITSAFKSVDLNSTAQSMSDEGMRAIFFQIFFTLDGLQRIGVQHNDLHTSNILIEEPPKDAPKYICYYLQKKCSSQTNEYYTFYVPSKFGFVRIFDWDLAVYSKDNSSYKANPIYDDGEYCGNLGICPDINDKYDMYTVLSCLRDSHIPRMNDETKSFFRDIFKNHYEITKNRICNSVNGSFCVPFPDRSLPKDIASPYEALTHRYFNCYRQ